METPREFQLFPELPEDISQDYLLQFLTLRSLLNLGQTCKTFHSIIREPFIWRRVLSSFYLVEYNGDYPFELFRCLNKTYPYPLLAPGYPRIRSLPIGSMVQLITLREKQIIDKDINRDVQRFTFIIEPIIKVFKPYLSDKVHILFGVKGNENFHILSFALMLDSYSIELKVSLHGVEFSVLGLDVTTFFGFIGVDTITNEKFSDLPNNIMKFVEIKRKIAEYKVIEAENINNIKLNISRNKSTS